MDQPQSDLVTFHRLRSLDQERKRLLGRYEMSRKDSPERTEFAEQIYACDQAMDRLLGATDLEKERNLARIMDSVAHEQSKVAIVESKMAERDAGMNQITRGFGCLAIAGLVTAITYFAAKPGDSYYVFWGGMAWGAWMIISGILRARSGK